LNPSLLGSWESPPQRLKVNVDQVHLWRVYINCMNEGIGDLEVYLNGEERERGMRLHFDHSRNQFYVSHASLRLILSRYLDLSPIEIVFGTAAGGKPIIEAISRTGGLSFNLSHSGEFVLIAVAREREVGVDVEQIRPTIDMERLAQRYFSAYEVRELLDLPIEHREAGFFRCWTRKEAYIKARGGGLALPLDQFDVSLNPNAPAALLATRDDPNQAERWSLYNVDVHENYQAALVAEGSPSGIYYWEFGPEILPSKR